MTQTNNIYGVVNYKGEHIDVSNSERGAKSFATRNGYKKISIRYNGGYDVVVIAEKNERGKWIAPIN
jgi:plastocyanin domain-containing protein